MGFRPDLSRDPHLGLWPPAERRWTGRRLAEEVAVGKVRRAIHLDKTEKKKRKLNDK